MSVTAEICPECGAPLTVVNGRCAFCETPLHIDQPATAPAPPPPLGPVGDPTAPFSMPIEDIFVIKGRGAIATGRIGDGTVQVGASLVLEHGGKTSTVVCAGIEMFRKQLPTAQAGDNVGLVLKTPKGKDLSREDIAGGDLLHAG